jgi:hypothetical protein
MSEDREQRLQRLGSIKETIMWIGPGQITEFCQSVHLLTADGLYTGYARLPKPVTMTHEDYIKGKKALIDNEKDYDLRVVEMIQDGCEPGIEYMRSDLHPYKHLQRQEYIADLTALYEKHNRFQPWSELNDEELLTYCLILDYVEQGYTSWDQVPDPS